MSISLLYLFGPIFCWQFLKNPQKREKLSRYIEIVASFVSKTFGLTSQADCRVFRKGGASPGKKSFSFIGTNLRSTVMKWTEKGRGAISLAYEVVNFPWVVKKYFSSVDTEKKPITIFTNRYVKNVNQKKNVQSFVPQGQRAPRIV